MGFVVTEHNKQIITLPNMGQNLLDSRAQYWNTQIVKNPTTYDGLFENWTYSVNFYYELCNKLNNYLMKQIDSPGTKEDYGSNEINILHQMNTGENTYTYYRAYWIIIICPYHRLFPITDYFFFSIDLTENKNKFPRRSSDTSATHCLQMALGKRPGGLVIAGWMIPRLIRIHVCTQT